MTLTTSPATTPSPFDALAPLRLPADLRLTPEQFEQVCADIREAVLELAADGRVIWMPPVGGEVSLRNGVLTFQLGRFAKRSGDWIAFASCAGFRLPDGSVLSPDASLVRLDCWQAFTPEQRLGFALLCPELVVELASPSEEGPRGVTALRQKMATYQANDASLGWLLLPHEQVVEVFNAGAEPQRLEKLEVLEAGAEFPGLRLELAEIWAG